VSEIHELRRVLDGEMSRLQAPPGLERRVLDHVLARRVPATAARVRATAYRVSSQTLKLVAGVLVLALLVSLVVVGRLARQEANPPAGGLTSAEQAELAALEARPLNLPALPAGASCPATTAWIAPYRGNVPEPAWGSRGPVYVEHGVSKMTARYFVNDNTIVLDRTVRGLVLIRGGSTDGRYTAGFAGQYAWGPVIDTEDIDGRTVQLHSELVLPSSRAPRDPRAAPGWKLFPVEFAMNLKAAGCGAYQLDTPSSTEVVIPGPAPGNPSFPPIPTVGT